MIVLLVGVVVPLVLHVVAPQQMPWWPDTASLAIGFTIVAIVVRAKYRRDREMNRRVWRAISAAIGRRRA
ncbi:MAG TPA: hypothetical protein VFA27_02875 [Vicinamibacterales bacterium]|nr:hypothetical protein [Vicinamibacterales bacterium]